MSLTNASLLSGTTLFTIAATDPEGAAVTYGLIGNYKLKMKSSEKPENSGCYDKFFVIIIILKDFGNATSILFHLLLND